METYDIEAIFYYADEFCKGFQKYLESIAVDDKEVAKSNAGRPRVLTLSEAMTIEIFFNFSGFKSFKDYYCRYVLGYLKQTNAFTNLPTYNRFVELKKELFVPTTLFLKSLLGDCTGISYIDSFKIEACHILREKSHKVFKGVARKGKTSTGWFFGLKLHLIVNEKGELISLQITSGNVADNNHDLLRTLLKNTHGKIFGDKGYRVKQDFFEELFNNGNALFAKFKKNMKNKLVQFGDKIFLRGRGMIESVGDILKCHFQLQHTRHRSAINAFVHILSTLVAYCFREDKPHIRSEHLLGV